MVGFTPREIPENGAYVQQSLSWTRNRGGSDSRTGFSHQSVARLALLKKESGFLAGEASLGVIRRFAFFGEACFTQAYGVGDRVEPLDGGDISQ